MGITNGPDDVIIFICDECGEELNTDTDEFYEALDIMRDEGWRSEREEHRWFHYCDGC